MSYLRHDGEVRIPGDLVDDQCAVFHVIRVDVTQAPVVLDVLRQMQTNREGISWNQSVNTHNFGLS